MQITKQFFGLHTLSAGNAKTPLIPQAGLVRSLNVSSYTLLDWQGLNPKGGQINLGSNGSTGSLDGWVTDRKNLGQTPIFVFANPPAWVGATGSTTYITARAAFITAVVTQFKGRIPYYELQNEVNDQTGVNWKGTIQQLVTQCAADYKLIKSIDPAATVLSANFTSQIGLPPGYPINATDFLKAGGESTFDVFSIHLYGCTAAEDAYAFLKQAQSLTSKPVWSTEGNWGYNANLKLPANSQAQADYLVKTALICLMLGAPMVWYGLDTDNATDGGLIDKSTGGLNLPGNAYKALIAEMVGATVTGSSVNGGAYQLNYTRADGVQRQASWNGAASPQFTTVPVPTPTPLPTPLPAPAPLPSYTFPLVIQSAGLTLTVTDATHFSLSVGD